MDRAKDSGNLGYSCSFAMKTKSKIPVLIIDTLVFNIYLHEVRGSNEGLRAEMLTSLNSNGDILQYIETNSVRGHCLIQ